MRYLALASSLLTGLAVATIAALAAAPGVINQYNALCNPDFPKQCILVDSAGAIAVTGAGGGGSLGAQTRATAAPPVYVEGSTTNPLSSTLSGDLRTLPAAKATGAPPTYSEGIINPFSMDLSGSLRVTGNFASSMKATAADPVYSEAAIVPPSGDLSGYVRAKVKAGAGAYVAGSISSGAALDGWDATQGFKADPRSTATDTTPASIVSILKELSFLGQNPVSQPVSQVGSPWGMTISGNVPVTQVTSPWVVSQSGAWNVGQSGAPWSVTGSGAAGTPAAGVITVQGSPSGSAVPVSGSVGIAGNVPVTQITSPWIVSGAVTQSGTWNVGQVGSPWGVVGAATAADDAALTAALKTFSLTGLYDGVGIDLARESTVALNSAGVGLQPAQMVGQCDDTTPPAVTEGNFGNVRMNCADHSLLVTVLAGGGGGGSSAMTATAADPTYVEATSNPISGDLKGYQRVLVKGGGVAGTPATGVVTVQGIAGGTPQPVSGTIAISGNVPVTQVGSPWGISGAVTQGGAPWSVTAAQSGAWNVGQTGAPWGVTITPSATATVGIPPVVSAALETGRVLKASAGNLYGVEVTTTNAAGYLLVFNAAAVPAAGAVSPVAHCYVAAFATCGLNFMPPLYLSAGVSVAFSTATTPFTKTDSATAAFSGQAQ